MLGIDFVVFRINVPELVVTNDYANPVTMRGFLYQ